MARVSLIEQAKSRRVYLEAGIHENCVVASYQATDPTKPNKQSLINIVKLDSDSKEMGKQEVSWFLFDHNGPYVNQNLLEYFTQVDAILQTHYTEDEIDTVWDPFRNIPEIETLDDIKEQIKRKAVLVQIFKNCYEDFAKLLNPMIEAYESKDFRNPFRLKLILKNSYVNPPNYGAFVESMSIPKENTHLKMSIPEQKEIDKFKNVVDPATIVTEPAAPKTKVKETVEDNHNKSDAELLNSL